MFRDEAKRNIEKAQESYIKQYEKRHSSSLKADKFKVGDKVQFRCRYKDKKQGDKYGAKWKPIRGFHVVKQVISDQYVALIAKPGGVATKAFHYNDLRHSSVKYLKGADGTKTDYQKLRKKTGGKSKKKSKSSLRNKSPKKISPPQYPPKKSVTTKSGRKSSQFDFSV